MGKEDKDDYFVKSIAESLRKIFWGLLFVLLWLGAILNGSIFFILAMLPISYWVYRVMYKADASSNAITAKDFITPLWKHDEE